MKLASPVPADVPTMYQANGKQRATAGNTGHLTRRRAQVKTAFYQGERLVTATASRSWRRCHCRDDRFTALLQALVDIIRPARAWLSTDDVLATLTCCRPRSAADCERGCCPAPRTSLSTA